MRAAWVRFGLLLVLACAFFACSSGGGGDDQSPASGNWDELVWDEGNWQ